MSTAVLFRQYAEEALRQAVQSKNEKEKLALIELMRTWTQAAEAKSRYCPNSDSVLCPNLLERSHSSYV
jgi:hypothetical protein